MLKQLDRKLLAEILSAIKQTYTDQLGWNASDDETYIEGAVLDAMHEQFFNGEPPPDFAAPYIYNPTEEPRKTLTKHRRDEIRTFLQKKWQGPGGVILAEEMIDHTINAVLADHRQRHSLER
jgi:hypothetical protein